MKDEEGLEGNATAVLSVIKETDYPPTANAGGDQIIYLPQVSVKDLFVLLKFDSKMLEVSAYNCISQERNCNQHPWHLIYLG